VYLLEIDHYLDSTSRCRGDPGDRPPPGRPLPGEDQLRPYSELRPVCQIGSVL